MTTPTRDTKRARLRRKLAKLPGRKKVTVAAVPGMTPEQLAEAAKARPAQRARVGIIDIGRDQVERDDDVADLAATLDAGRPDWASVRWVNVEGLHDKATLALLAKHFELHPLAMEDVINTGQRPKAEAYGDPEPGKPRFFVVSRMVHTDDIGAVVPEQVSLFLGLHTVITIQQRPGDVWDPVRTRINKPGSRFRTLGTGYLAYTLLDAMIDALFPLMDRYAERIEDIEDRILLDPDESIIHEVHALKRELMLVRREAGPMRELIRSLLDQDVSLFDEQTRLYLRDVADHAVAIIELLETYRELASGLGEAWMTAMSNRMNEVMKVLTIIASMFIPVSFLAGVFGMNFEKIPLMNNGWWGFGLFSAGCFAITFGMWWWFRRKGWL